MKTLTWLLVLLAISALLLAPVVRAQEDEGEEVADDHTQETTEETDEYDEEVFDDESGRVIMEPSPDAVLSYYFPKNTDKRFTQGEEVTVLIGLLNTGSKTFNVSYIGGSLLSPFDNTYYIQNFTVREVTQGVVEGGRQGTFAYSFIPDPNLEPLEFVFQGWVVYNSTDNDLFRSTFANVTVELVEPSTTFDIRRVLSYVFILAAMGALVYGALAATGIKTKRKRSKVNKEKEWGEVNVYKQAEQSRRVGSRKSNKK